MIKPFHFLAAAALSAACLAGCANVTTSAAREVTPDALVVPAGQTLMLKTQASGVQIYRCQPAKDDATHFEWALRAPEADLSDDLGNPIGKHYAGPTWEAADGSRVVGEVKGRDNGPDPTAIPWLLLAAKSNSDSGVFAAVRYVQRLHTVGGKAPADGCDAGHAGTETRVAYKADYYFYSATPAATP